MVRERSEFTPPLRVHHHGRHYIAYTIEGGSVLILRIVRDEADLDYLFGS
jgi:toxin ParE1/3/4